MPESKQATIVVWPNRYVSGFGGGDLNEVDIFDVRPLEHALAQTYYTDAHFVPYYIAADPVCPRLKKSSLSWVRERGSDVVFDIIVVDVDCPEAHKAGGAAPEDWRVDQMRHLRDTPWWDNAGFYETRGGYRLLWLLEAPLPVEPYLGLLKALIDELKQYGIPADDLKDWTRCYRLPYVKRDGEQQELTLDIDDLGVFDVKPLLPEDTGDLTNQKLLSLFSGIEEVNRKFELPEDIPQGGRNKLLASFAGKLRRGGATVEEITAALLVVNQQRCEPPLGDDEVAASAASISKYEPGQGSHLSLMSEDAEGIDGMFALGSEMEIARVACRQIENESGPPLVLDRSELWLYRDDAGLWTTFPPEAVRNVVGSFDGALVQKGTYPDGRPKVSKLRVGHRLRVNVSECVFDLRAHKGFFDTAKDGLTFNNCFVSVSKEGIQTEPLCHKQRATVGLPFDYAPRKKPKMFLAALKSCFVGDEDCLGKISLLQQFVGVCLVGAATKYQRGLILLGAGANGKSTVQLIISALFDHNMISAIAPQDMDQEYRRAMLAGSRLNVVNELPEADILVSESVKAMISGDRVVGRHIRQAPFEFIPKAGHLFAANSLPGVKDMSHGFWRRWIILEFTRTFLPEDQKKNLARDVIRKELPDIASWAIEGALAVAKQNGYAVPVSSLDAIGQWRKDADQVASFLENYFMQEGAELEAKAAKLYNSYCAWSMQNGHRQMGSKKFSQRLSGLGATKKRVKAGHVYLLKTISKKTLFSS